MNITKADIVDRLSENVGITKTEAKVIVEEVLNTFVTSLSEGKKIELRGFGVFNTKHRTARTARNPKTGESIKLGERFVPIFKPSLEFTKKVNDKLLPTTKKTAKKSKTVATNVEAKSAKSKAKK